MKRFLILLILVCGICGTATAGSSLRIRNPRFEFGWMPYNSTVVHHFWFVSVGKDTLKIDDINTRSATVRMPLEQNRIAPGDSVKIPVYWDSGSKGQAVERRWEIITDSYVDDPIECLLKGIAVTRPDSLRPVLIRPHKLELSRLGKLSIDSLIFDLVNYSDRDFEMELVSVPSDEFEIIIPDSLRAHESVTGLVRISPEYVDKEFIGSATIQITHYLNYEKRITIPIRRKLFSR